MSTSPASRPPSKNSLSTGRNAGRGKTAYSWISSDPANAGPTLGGGGGGGGVV